MFLVSTGNIALSRNTFPLILFKIFVRHKVFRQRYRMIKTLPKIFNRR